MKAPGNHRQRPGLLDRVAGVAELEDGVWVTPGAGADVAYPETSHDQLVAVEDQSTWYAERNRLIVDALAADGLPAQLLEVGAGNGFVAARLRALGVDAVAVEPGRSAAEASARRGVPTVCGLLEDLELPDASVEAAGVFDVLEHVPDTRPLLAELHRVLAPGGRLAVTVPAMPALWSQADDTAHHSRRYSRGGLVRELEAAGFDARSCRYAFGSLVPVVALVRTLPYRLGRRRSRERSDEVGTRQVAGYGDAARTAARAAFAAERALRRVVDLPFGTSLVAVALRR